MKTKFPEKIETPTQAKAFMRSIVKMDVCLHPDDDANDIVDRDGKKFFSDKDADRINDLYEQVFNLTDFDPYEYGIQIMNSKYGIHTPHQTQYTINKLREHFPTANWKDQSEANYDRSDVIRYFINDILFVEVYVPNSDIDDRENYLFTVYTLSYPKVINGEIKYMKLDSKNLDKIIIRLHKESENLF